MIIMRFILILCLTFTSIVVQAKTNLPLPRYVSIKSNEVNARTGPNVRYPIKWVYVKKGEPIELVAEFEQWRKIRDKEGGEGWVHESMVSGRRRVIIIGDKQQKVFIDPDENTKAIFLIEANVRATLNKCQNQWCEIEVENHKGWIERKYLWGVYKNEEIK
jgi:SH3-like domain-containing protein